MPYAAAISEHPVPATAIGEVVGHVLEKVGDGADLVCLFVSPHHLGALEDLAGAVKTLLDPRVLIGCAADAVIGPGREAEGAPGISIWSGHVGPVQAVRLDVIDVPNGTGRAINGWPIDLDWVPAGAVLFADPFSFPVPALFDVLNQAGGFPRVTGGMASAGKRPGGNRLILNDDVYDDGAVGVLIGASERVWIENIVAQGCRPIGQPYVVTSADGNVIAELGGRPALQRLSDMIKSELSSEEIELAQNGLLIGKVIDEHKSEFAAGDFLIRTLIDSDPLGGSLTVGEKIEVGTTVQFHLRDAHTATAELVDSLVDRDANAVLLFSGQGRGFDLFEMLDHDAKLVGEMFNDPPTAGFFAAGEFGPQRSMNLVHGFSASLALFTDH